LDPSSIPSRTFSVKGIGEASSYFISRPTGQSKGAWSNNRTPHAALGFNLTAPSSNGRARSSSFRGRGELCRRERVARLGPRLTTSRRIRADGRKRNFTLEDAGVQVARSFTRLKLSIPRGRRGARRLAEATEIFLVRKSSTAIRDDPDGSNAIRVRCRRSTCPRPRPLRNVCRQVLTAVRWQNGPKGDDRARWSVRPSFAAQRLGEPGYAAHRCGKFHNGCICR